MWRRSGIRKLQMASDAFADGRLPKAEAIAVESVGPLAAFKYLVHSKHDARQKLAEKYFARLRAKACFLISFLQANLVSQKDVRVKRLQKPRRLRWHHDGPYASRLACAQDLRRSVRGKGIEEKDDLVLTHNIF